MVKLLAVCYGNTFKELKARNYSSLFGVVHGSMMRKVYF